VSDTLERCPSEPFCVPTALSQCLHLTQSQEKIHKQQHDSLGQCTALAPLHLVFSLGMRLAVRQDVIVWVYSCPRLGPASGISRDPATVTNADAANSKSPAADLGQSCINPWLHP
jgi:hypothetical protein